MKMPIIIISYGDFSITKKLFSYQEFNTTKIPVFTNPTVAALFIKSISHTLKVQVCDNTQTIIDILRLAYMMYPSMVAQINPRPWDTEAMTKLESSGEMEDTRVINIEELINEIQSSNGL